MREIVVPGEKIAEGKLTKAGFGAFKRGDEVFASVHGLVETDKDFVKVVPLSGKYMPHVGDQVIGIVVMLIGKGCFVNINSAYDGYYGFMRDTQYNVGDLITAEIMEVDEVNSVTLDYAKPLYDGKLIEVASVKVPRIVGKKASMIDILSQGSGCRIFVGRNGRIFLTGEDANIRRAEAAIRLIEREAHTTGLTDRVKEFLGKGV